MEVEVHKNGKVYKQRYEKWVPMADLKEIWDTDKTGTIVSFMPDASIFDTIEFNGSTEVARMKQAACFYIYQ